MIIFLILINNSSSLKSARMIHHWSYQPPVPPACVSKTIQACQRDPQEHMERDLGPGLYVYDQEPAGVRGGEQH